MPTVIKFILHLFEKQKKRTEQLIAVSNFNFCSKQVSIFINSVLETSTTKGSIL